MRAMAASMSTGRPVSAAAEVMATPARPQGTMAVKRRRSLSRLMAMPWVATPRETWMPSEAILRSPTQSPRGLLRHVAATP